MCHFSLSLSSSSPPDYMSQARSLNGHRDHERPAQSKLTPHLPLTKALTRSLVLLLVGLGVGLSVGCNDTSPPDSSSSHTQTSRGAKTSKEEHITLASDQVDLRRSYLQQLVRDPVAIKPWEGSDGLVALFQSKLTEAYNALYEELKEHPQDMTRRIAFNRVTLELIDALTRVEAMEVELFPQWVNYELSRPNVGKYAFWYEWIELSALSEGIDISASLKKDAGDRAERIAHLTQTLNARGEDVAGWSRFALDINAAVPSTPYRPKAGYQRWVRFARAVKGGDLKRARTLSLKLKLSKPMLSLPSTSDTQKLDVFDPRVTRSLRRYYLRSLLESCRGVSLSAYYCGRAHELNGEIKHAIRLYQDAIRELDLSLTLPEDKRHTFDHFVLSSHLNHLSLYHELKSRLIRLGSTPPVLSPEVYPNLSQAQLALGALKNVNTSADLWRRITPDPKGEMKSLLKPQSLFPQRKSELSSLIASWLERERGPGRGLVLGVQLPDRWIDELHYLYAEALVTQDQRTIAIKTLNAAEEARLGGQLTDASGNGHNRLKRLLLSSHVYLKMDQQRITIKYLRRLQSLFPTLSFALGMTSDVLSGKSFEQNNGQSNSGQ